MRIAGIVLALCLLGNSAVALAQELESPTESEGGKPKGQTAAKRAACRGAGIKDGLRGQALSDHVQLCFEEAKLACLKDAIAKKVTGKDRKDFIQKCLDTPN